MASDVFKVNQTKIKGGCQLGRKVVSHNFKSDLPQLHFFKILVIFGVIVGRESLEIILPETSQALLLYPMWTSYTAWHQMANDPDPKVLG